MNDEQRRAIEPQVTRLRELLGEVERQKRLILAMASMVDARVLDPESGVSFNTNTLEFDEAKAARDEGPNPPDVP